MPCFRPLAGQRWSRTTRSSNSLWVMLHSSMRPGPRHASLATHTGCVFNCRVSRWFPISDASRKAACTRAAERRPRVCSSTLFGMPMKVTDHEIVDRQLHIGIGRGRGDFRRRRFREWAMELD
jgi:hypothetical protein